jgi:CspA family cold shock protein
MPLGSEQNPTPGVVKMDLRMPRLDGGAHRRCCDTQANDLQPSQSRERDMSVRQRGTVRWYSQRKGYGFITSEAGELLVYSNAFEGDGLRHVVAGMGVSFIEVQGASGKQAEHVRLLG